MLNNSIFSFQIYDWVVKFLFQLINGWGFLSFEHMNEYFDAERIYEWRCFDAEGIYEWGCFSSSINTTIHNFTFKKIKRMIVVKQQKLGFKLYLMFCAFWIISILVRTFFLYEYMNFVRNDVYNLFYHGIIYIANEGHDVRRYMFVLHLSYRFFHISHICLFLFIIINTVKYINATV